MTSQRFFETLFETNELAVFGDNIYATRPTKAIQNGVKEQKPFFVINPIMKGSTRGIDGVQHFRNFLFEIDEDNFYNTVPLEKQREIISESQLPWTTCTYSGGKSLHWIVSLETPLEDAYEYRIWWKMIEAVLNKTASRLGYNLKFDGNVKDPSRFSRSPNAIRLSKEGGRVQTLESVKSRINNEELLQWFETNEVKQEDFVPKPSQFEIGEINQTASDIDKMNFILNVLLKDNKYEQGNKRVWQFTYARAAKRCGLDQNTIKNQLIQICGKIEDNNPIESAFSDKYISDEPLYVLSQQDRRSWAKRKALEEDIQKRQEIIDSGESSKHLHINGVYNYLRIGTDFFKKNEKKQLRPWKKETLVMDFGTDTIKQFPEELKYDGFCNIVNFLEEIEFEDKLYNRFTRPQWTPSEGKWPTTEKLLRKVFSEVGIDQWEQGLDWIQLQLTEPKQKLHCLILGSKGRETGKDTFVEWMTMLLGNHNVYFADIDNFLKPFNSAYADKCLIALNEVKFSSINDGSMEKIKNYITQATVLIDEKFQTPVTVDYYGKMIMLTNNVHDFMKLDDEENRFWIRTMPELNKKKDFDPYFKDKLLKEIPHFLHMILNRELDCKEKDGRFWLPETITHTSERERLVENSKSSLYLEIRDLLEDTLTERPELDELSFVPRDIREILKSKYDSQHDLKYIKKTLQKDFKLLEKKTIFQNSYTGEKKNSRFFSILRTQIFETDDTTPDLGSVFDIES